MLKEYVKKKIKEMTNNELDIEDDDIYFFIYIYLMALLAALYSLVIVLKYYWDIDIPMIIDKLLYYLY